MVESGYVSKRFDWWFKKEFGSFCAGQVGSTASFTVIKMADLTGILVVFGVFAVAAVTILTVERIL